MCPFLSYPSNHARGSQVQKSLATHKNHCPPKWFPTQPLDSQIECWNSQLNLGVLNSKLRILNSTFAFSTRCCGFSTQPLDYQPGRWNSLQVIFRTIVESNYLAALQLMRELGPRADTGKFGALVRRVTDTGDGPEYQWTRILQETFRSRG